MRQASARKDKNKEGPVCSKNKEEPACSSSGPFVCFRRVVDFSGAKTSKSVREEVGDIFDISAPTTRPSTVSSGLLSIARRASGVLELAVSRLSAQVSRIRIAAAQREISRNPLYACQR